MSEKKEHTDSASHEAGASCLIRRRNLCKMLGISVSASYLKANHRSPYFDPNFPKPVRIGPNSVAWKVGEVMTYINSLERA